MSRRFQFSIRFLLVATTAIAAATAAVRAESSWQASLAMDLLTVLFSTGAIIGVTQTDGTLKIFWIGVSISLGVATILAALSLWNIFAYSGKWNPSLGVPGKMALLCCAAPINGLFALFIHWLFAHRRDGDRFPVTMIATLALASLVATFLGGMWFGERRESDRRDQKEQQKQLEMDEEMDQ